MTALADRLRSLEIANEVRMTAAAFKRDLGLLGQRDALLEMARVLREEPERVRVVRIHVLLECVPRLGPSGVRRILTRPGFPIWPLRTVGELSERQRRVVAAELSRLAGRLPERRREEA